MVEAEQLIRDIEKKDRRFRIAQAVFNTVLLASAIITMILAYTILQNVQQQQHQLATAVEDLKQANAAQLKKANDHIDCIALFFAQSDRIYKTLNLTQRCDIVSSPPVLAPQASYGVNSKPVTVAPIPPTPPVVVASPPRSTQPVPAKGPARQLVDVVTRVINNIIRSFK